MTRAEKVARARALRDGGALLREIAAEFGVGVSTVDGWLNDPDGSRLRARKDSYRGRCDSCGGPTHGGDGPTATPAECKTCRYQRMHDERHWTREAIIEWIKAYAAERGCPPPSTVQTRRRREFSDVPHTEATHREFGTDGWRKALRAAGFEPYRDHPAIGHKLGRDHPRIREMLALHDEGVSGAEIAARQGVTSGAIYQRLKRWGQDAT